MSLLQVLQSTLGHLRDNNNVLEDITYDALVFNPRILPPYDTIFSAGQSISSGSSCRGNSAHNPQADRCERLDAGEIETVAGSAGHVIFKNGVVPKVICRYTKPLYLVGNDGWPCFNGGSIAIVGQVGGHGMWMQCLVFYLPVNQIDQPDPLSRPYQVMKADLAATKEFCMFEIIVEQQPGHKVDTTALARCIYNNFPKGKRGRGRRLRGTAVFLGSSWAELNDLPEAFGLAAAVGELYSDTIDLPLGDLNAHPLYLHVVVGFPI